MLEHDLHTKHGIQMLTRNLGSDAWTWFTHKARGSDANKKVKMLEHDLHTKHGIPMLLET
jgi:hypothetical protein